MLGAASNKHQRERSPAICAARAGDCVGGCPLLSNTNFLNLKNSREQGGRRVRKRGKGRPHSRAAQPDSEAQSGLQASIYVGGSIDLGQECSVFTVAGVVCTHGYSNACLLPACYVLSGVPEFCRPRREVRGEGD